MVITIKIEEEMTDKIPLPKTVAEARTIIKESKIPTQTRKDLKHRSLARFVDSLEQGDSKKE